ncbi:MAG: Uncharacterised protein [Cellulomonadaceae bacterium TMED98]|nr:MAG: Uncharacterised protein [Cellulomonadaceae bacterium TMED98]
MDRDGLDELDSGNVGNIAFDIGKGVVEGVIHGGV